MRRGTARRGRRDVQRQRRHANRGTFAVVAAAAALALLPAAAHAGGYEQVSPADSGAYDAPVVQGNQSGQTTRVDDQGRVYFPVGGLGTSDSPDGFPDGGVDLFVAEQGAGSWSSTWITPYCTGAPGIPAPGSPCPGPQSAEPQAFGGGRTVFSSTLPIDPLDTNATANLYLGDATTVRLLDRRSDTGEAAPSGPEGDLVGTHTAVAVTPDLSHVAFVTKSPLVPADTDAGSDVYLDDGGALALLTGPACDGTCVNVNGKDGPVFLSDDGSSVAFATEEALVAADTGSGASAYVVRNGTPRLLTDGASDVESTAFALTGDGSRAFVQTRDQLVGGDTDAELDVYVIDTVTGTAALVSDGTTVSPAAPAAWSDDGTVAFFLADEPVAGAPATGDRHLYAWDATNGVRYVGSAATTDTLGVGYPMAQRELRVTTDGGVAIFATSVDLLPAQDGNAVADIYRWQDGSLTLLTPRPGGAPVDDVRLAGMLPVNTTGTIPAQGRGIAAGGSAVYFQTNTPFVEADGDDERSDVYRWTAAGIELVSPPGSAPDDAFYLDNASDGSRVYFASTETILPSDLDAGQTDIYAWLPDGGAQPALPTPGGGLGTGGGGSGPAAEQPDAPSPPTTVPTPPQPVPVMPPDDRIPVDEQPPDGRSEPELDFELDSRRLDAGRRRVAVTFAVPDAGRVTVRIRQRGGHGRRGRVLARGSHRFTRADEDATMRARLTKHGRRRVRRAERRERDIRAVLSVRYRAADGTVRRDRTRVRLEVGRDG